MADHPRLSGQPDRPWPARPASAWRADAQAGHAARPRPAGDLGGWLVDRWREHVAGVLLLGTGAVLLLWRRPRAATAR
jgi:hypothetical protein